MVSSEPGVGGRRVSSEANIGRPDNLARTKADHRFGMETGAGGGNESCEARDLRDTVFSETFR
jgi:hypothetical protein